MTPTSKAMILEAHRLVSMQGSRKKILALQAGLWPYKGHSKILLCWGRFWSTWRLLCFEPDIPWKGDMFAKPLDSVRACAGTPLTAGWLVVDEEHEAHPVQVGKHNYHRQQGWGQQCVVAQAILLQAIWKWYLREKSNRTRKRQAQLLLP